MEWIAGEGGNRVLSDFFCDILGGGFVESRKVANFALYFNHGDVGAPDACVSAGARHNVWNTL